MVWQALTPRAKPNAMVNCKSGMVFIMCRPGILIRKTVLPESPPNSRARVGQTQPFFIPRRQGGSNRLNPLNP
jgi:hypothetical protein